MAEIFFKKLLTKIIYINIVDNSIRWLQRF